MFITISSIILFSDELSPSVTDVNKITYKLCSTIYRKPTDKNSLLHFKSYHPLHTKTSIIYSQAIRYRTIITNNKHLKKELNKLKNTLKQRKYPLIIINNQLNKIKNITQKQLLFGKNLKTKRPKGLKNTNHNLRIIPRTIGKHKKIQTKQLQSKPK